MHSHEPPAAIKHTESLIQSARELRERFLADPHRPRYHLLPPAGWMNDPNGMIYWEGRYHVFYQHHPDGAFWHHMQWGHASSVDLVHWVHHPIALTPTPGGPDREGCFSGCAVIWDGKPTFVYHGVPGGTCLATSDDAGLIHWEKHPANPVIPVPDHGEYTVYDPFAWHEGDYWYALSGNAILGHGDVAYLFRSTDMLDWEYRGPFYESRREWTDPGEDCAVPNFFPLGDRHMLLFVSHKCGMQHYLGSYENERFTIASHARMNWAGGPLIAPMTLLDPDDRRIMLGWICESRYSASSREAGWAGVLTLPRILTLAADGTVRIQPVPELEILRRCERSRRDLHVPACEELALDDITGDCLELDITVPDAPEFSLKLRCSPDGSEQTVVTYSPEKSVLRIDTSQSSLSPDVVQPWPCPWGNTYPDPLETRVLPHHTEPTEIADLRVQEAPLTLEPGEPLRLRVFLDKSVLEVYANDRQCLTQRIYPSRADSLGVRLQAAARDLTVGSLTAWDMAPAVP